VQSNFNRSNNASQFLYVEDVGGVRLLAVGPAHEDAALGGVARGVLGPQRVGRKLQRKTQERERERQFGRAREEAVGRDTQRGQRSESRLRVPLLPTS
jgi:hypothetical protein